MLRHLMDWPLWQAPFARRKLRLHAAADPSAFRGVRDIGCGPGSNAPHFRHCEYLELDISERYIAAARRSPHGPPFMVADATTLGTQGCILINSLLHHLADEDVDKLLAAAAGLLALDARVHGMKMWVMVHCVGARRED
jgi:SAM-dependent methyltransferase